MESDAFPRVKIGSLTWAAQDLQVSKFRNGEPIPLVKDDEEWAQLNSAAYCIAPGGYYLYNWFAVNDPRGLAPAGWHVPTDEEWEDLVHYLAQTLGGSENLDLVGALLKDDVAWDGMISSGFSALPGGGRGNNDGDFFGQESSGYWWSSSPSGTDAWLRILSSGNSPVGRDNDNARDGFSVRCVRD
jgi:uncharacterized protein (TIGR02145 family)